MACSITGDRNTRKRHPEAPRFHQRDERSRVQLTRVPPSHCRGSYHPCPLLLTQLAWSGHPCPLPLILFLSREERPFQGPRNLRLHTPKASSRSPALSPAGRGISRAAQGVAPPL